MSRVDPYSLLYVFPVNMVKRVLEDEGLADASLVHSAPTSKLADLFGADSVLYVTVNQWNAKYILLNTQVNVQIDYKIRDAKTDDLLWTYHQRMVYNSNNGGGGGGGLGGLIAGLIVEAVHAAITKAAPNYLPLANQANTLSLLTYPGNGIPPGPYATEQKELSPNTGK